MCLVTDMQAPFCCEMLEFRRRGVAQKLMSPLGISSPSRTSPGFTFNRVSLSESPAFSTAGEDSVVCVLLINLCCNL